MTWPSDATTDKNIRTSIADLDEDTRHRQREKRGTDGRLTVRLFVDDNDLFFVFV